MRSGYGKSITHYKYEYGNYLAGQIYLYDKEINNKESIEYLL